MDKDRYTVEKRVKIRKQIKASMKIFLKAKLTKKQVNDFFKDYWTFWCFGL